MSAVELVYIRSGDLPEGGRSRNYRTNELEAGVSVYEGILRDGKALILAPKATAGSLDAMLTCEDRPCYLVTGDRVGTGSDGEPVLANVQTVRRVELWGAEPVATDPYAGLKPQSDHRLNQNYCVSDSEDYTITCTCGMKFIGPNYYDCMAAFDSHIERHRK